MVVVSGGWEQTNRRYGCGFHRDKGPQVCTNGLTVPVKVVEARLLTALRTRVLRLDAVQYLVTAVNAHLGSFHAGRAGEERRLETELAQVETELKNVEQAILSGMTGTMTAALLHERESLREALQERLKALRHRPLASPLQVDSNDILARLEKLDELLQKEVGRANAIFRTILEPIALRPVEAAGKRMYRATGAAKGLETLERLGLTQAFDFGGCGGPQPLAGK
jgi:site-specific DNA recombinase